MAGVNDYIFRDDEVVYLPGDDRWEYLDDEYAGEERIVPIQRRKMEEEEPSKRIGKPDKKQRRVARHLKERQSDPRSSSNDDD